VKRISGHQLVDVPEVPAECALVVDSWRRELQSTHVNAVDERLDNLLLVALQLVQQRLQPTHVHLRVSVQEYDHLLYSRTDVKTYILTFFLFWSRFSFSKRYIYFFKNVGKVQGPDFQNFLRSSQEELRKVLRSFENRAPERQAD